MTTHEYRIEGPFGAKLGDQDTVPKFALNSRLVTQHVDSAKTRIYRYVRTRAAMTAGSLYKLSSTGEVLSIATSTVDTTATAGPRGRALCISNAGVSSPTGSAYFWAQTGGYFDNGSDQGGDGILAVSATANYTCFLGTTPGALTTTAGASRPDKLPRTYAIANGSTADVYVYCSDELAVVDDIIA